tara:strand:- start:415 stop:669 length:255 start_codon:yes stop_codon:yes gene_type:complete
MDTRQFIASSEIFSNFKMNISLYDVSSIDDIVNIFTTELKNVLKEYNFTALLKILEDKRFHIHSYKIEDILTSEEDHIFYICDH